MPDETLYIIDGTSMLYNAHFSRENQNYWREAYLSPEESAKVIEHWGLERLLSQPAHPQSLSSSSSPDATVFDDSLSPILYLDDDDGLPTVPVVHCGALTTMLLHFARFIRDVQPRYVAMAFDAGRVTFRNEMYPEYKQHRSATPLYLVPLLRLAPPVVEALGCRCFLRDNFEADDVMASLSRWAVDRGMHVVHVSADKVGEGENQGEGCGRCFLTTPPPPQSPYHPPSPPTPPPPPPPPPATTGHAAAGGQHRARDAPQDAGTGGTGRGAPPLLTPSRHPWPFLALACRPWFPIVRRPFSLLSAAPCLH